jgi:hypothetical protein
MHTPNTNRRSFRRTALLLLLAALIALAGWSEVKRHRLEKEMAPHVADCVQESTTPDLETRAILTVSRDYVIAGPARAKVEVFNRERNTREIVPQKLEYYFTRQDGQWERQGSGRCSDEKCVIEATELFGGHTRAQAPDNEGD